MTAVAVIAYDTEYVCQVCSLVRVVDGVGSPWKFGGAWLVPGTLLAAAHSPSSADLSRTVCV